MMKNQNAKTEQPTLWTQYEKLIDLHKFYFEHIMRAAVLSLGIIGAIVTYVISAGIRDTRVSLAMLVPILLSIGSFILCVLGSSTRGISRIELRNCNSSSKSGGESTRPCSCGLQPSLPYCFCSHLLA
jgi:hypothetical protein